MLFTDTHQERLAGGGIVAHAQGGIVDARQLLLDALLQPGRVVAVAAEEVGEEANVVHRPAGDAVEGVLHPGREPEVDVVREMVAQQLGDAEAQVGRNQHPLLPDGVCPPSQLGQGGLVG